MPGSPRANSRSAAFSYFTPQTPYVEERNGAALAFEHLQWLSTERKCSASYELMALRAFLAAAKFIHGGGDMDEEGDLDKPYAHIPLVRQLRKIAKETGKRADKASPSADTRKKWLSWDQYMDLVSKLEAECAPLTSMGAVRPLRVVAWSVQRYLIFGILSCVPDRQRTIRELEIGRTLFKEEIDQVRRSDERARARDERE